MILIQFILGNIPLWEKIRFFIPFRIIRGQLLIMRPYVYGGSFGMRSINKLREGAGRGVD